MKVAIPLILMVSLSAPGAIAQTAENPALRSKAAPSAETHIDTVDVQANKIPLDEAVHSFVKSYAHPTETAGKIARWSRQMPLCPDATGLLPAFNVFVVERIRTVAGLVGAASNQKVPCTPNLVVMFSAHPQDLLDDIAKNNEDLLGYHEVSQKKQLATMSHPIQAWYETATRDINGLLRTDRAWQDPECVIAMQDVETAVATLGAAAAYSDPSLMGRVQMFCGGTSVTGNRALDGLHGEIGEVTIMVDTNKIIGMPLGAVSDYIAMLALSQTKVFETCQPLPSITNIMTTSCAAQKAQTLTDADVAYLKAVYKSDSDVIGELQTLQVAHQMENLLKTSSANNAH